jgi:hypothetical protein
MSKNLTRKGLAFAAGVALATTGLVATPAQAAAGDFLTIKANTGSILSVFNSDTLTVDVTITEPSYQLAGYMNNIQYRFTGLTGADSIDVDSELPVVAAPSDKNGATANGVVCEARLSYLEIASDTQIATAKHLVVGTMSNAAVKTALDATPADDDITVANCEAALLGPNTTATAAAILKSYTIPYAAGVGAIIILPGTHVVAGTGAGTTDSRLAAYTGTASRDIVISAPADEDDYGQGDTTVQLTVWAETDGNPGTVDTVSSKTETLRFLDPKSVPTIPRIERFEAAGGPTENDTVEDVLGATLQFGKPVNLVQTNLARWDFELIQADPDATGADAANATKHYYGELNNQNLGDFDVLPSFATDRDDADRLYFEFSGVDAALANSFNEINGVKTATGTTVDFAMNAGDTYTFAVNRLNATDALTSWRTSPTFALPAGTASTDAVGIEATVATADVSDQVDEADTGVALLVGANAVTYTAQLTDDAANGAGEATEIASVPVLATVKSVTFLKKDSSYVVSGTADRITAKNQTVFATGFTNSDGQFDLTVTSSSAAAGESYEVTFHFLKNSAWTDATKYTMTYGSAGAATFKATNTVLGGDTVTAEFSVADQFGAAVTTSGGKALSVILQATNTDDYEEIVAIDANGEASFTFDNYVDAGASDLMTATLVTGTLTSNSPVLTAITLTLYNTNAVGAINVAETYTGEITYADFVDGKVSSTNPAPGTKTAQIVGSVVDTNGAGIPGAPVTLAADNMNFLQAGGSTYSIDSINVVTDAAGTFAVDVWTHTVTGGTGADVTITSGGVSTTTEIESYLPDDIAGKNLVFKMTTPANIVMNTTYAVTLSLTDKWGNPIATAGDTVKVEGAGSVLINSNTSGVTKDFNKDGTTTVFVRSEKDIPGPGSIDAKLIANATYAGWDGAAVDNAAVLGITEETVNDVKTVWDETAFQDSLAVDVEVLTSAPAASADAKVNAGSFNGYVAVYAKGYKGQTLSWKIAGEWFKTTITEDYQVFQRTTAAVGVDVTVELYINGQRPAALVKQVLTR